MRCEGKILAAASSGSEFRVQAVRNRVNAELQTWLIHITPPAKFSNFLSEAVIG
jgi:hypothetical protein